jgi:RNase P/RNase MRP subunit p30
MIAKLILALRMWRRDRLLTRAARKRKRAFVLESKAESLYDIINAELRDESWL